MEASFSEVVQLALSCLVAQVLYRLGLCLCGHGTFKCEFFSQNYGRLSPIWIFSYFAYAYYFSMNLMYLPVCLCLFSFGLTTSVFDKERRLREDLFSDIGRGLAINYWDGYLKHVAPKIMSHIEGVDREHSDKHFPVKKMLLLIPNSCDFPKNPNMEEHGFEVLGDTKIRIPVNPRACGGRTDFPVSIAKLDASFDGQRPVYIAYDFPQTLHSSMGSQKMEDPTRRRKNVDTFVRDITGILGEQERTSEPSVEIIRYDDHISDQKLSKVIEDKILGLRHQNSVLINGRRRQRRGDCRIM